MWPAAVPRCAVASLLLAALAAAHAAGCRDAVPDARTLGAGTFCVLGFCLYDARLVAPGGALSWDAPFALSLSYRRHLSGARIADAGAAEFPPRCGENSYPKGQLPAVSRSR